MSYDVSVAVQPRRPIAAVAATTTWHRFPGQWRGMLGEVWACLRQAGVKAGCNVMLYRDLPTAGHVAVEVGVEVSEPLAVTGAVMMSALPAGLAAGTTHRGPYEEIDVAHQAVLRWCAVQRRETTGERWEVYGDWHEDPGPAADHGLLPAALGAPGSSSSHRAGSGGLPAEAFRRRDQPRCA